MKTKFIILAIFLISAFPFPVLADSFQQLPVPFTSEIPDGRWVGPWKNACEEASIVMVEQYYLGQTTLTKQKAKSEMQRYFDIENRIFGQNANTNAAETARLINEYSTSFNARVIDNPTLDQIKTELTAGRPVISLHYGYELRNPLINFARNGSYYHMMVLIGFDDENDSFIVNDDGNRSGGQNFRYSYDTIMRSLHDYDQRTRKTNGIPRVLFTYAKFAKAAGSHRIYRIEDSEKRYISNPRVFRNRGWKWEAVRNVDAGWLNNMETGEEIAS